MYKLEMIDLDYYIFVTTNSLMDVRTDIVDIAAPTAANKKRN